MSPRTSSLNRNVDLFLVDLFVCVCSRGVVYLGGYGQVGQLDFGSSFCQVFPVCGFAAFRMIVWCAYAAVQLSLCIFSGSCYPVFRSLRIDADFIPHDVFILLFGIVRFRNSSRQFIYVMVLMPGLRVCFFASLMACRSSFLGCYVCRAASCYFIYSVTV